MAERKDAWQRKNASLKTLERENERMQREIDQHISNIEKNLRKDPHCYDELKNR